MANKPKSTLHMEKAAKEAAELNSAILWLTEFVEDSYDSNPINDLPLESRQAVEEHDHEAYGYRYGY